MTKVNIKTLIMLVSIVCVASIAIILISTNYNKTDDSSVIISEGQVALGAESAPDATINLLCEGKGTIQATPYKKGYTQGEPIEFIPHADEGWRFDRWEGDIPNEFHSNDSVKIKIPQGVYTVIAIFIQE